MIFGKKVSRRTGDVSLARLSHLLPGCMTEGILGTLSYAHCVKRFKNFQRTRTRLVCLAHVVKSLQLEHKAMHRLVTKETHSEHPSATFSHVIRLLDHLRSTSDGAYSRNVISVHNKPVFSLLWVATLWSSSSIFYFTSCKTVQPIHCNHSCYNAHNVVLIGPVSVKRPTFPWIFLQLLTHLSTIFNYESNN